MVRGIWALTVALPLALAACSSSDDKACEDFCGEGAACVGGRCAAVAACTPACGAGEACQDGACVATLASACAGSCGDGQICVTSGGAAACVSPCGEGQAWNATTGTCQATGEYCGAGQTWDAAALECKLTNLHAAYFDGKTLANGPAVTAECIKCHEEDAREMAGAAHFQWLGPTPDLVGREEAGAVGKKNLINNFCIAVASNEPRCTQCHAGYGDAANKVPGYELTGDAALGRVDCLVCHADMATGYTKAAATWGSADVASTASGCSPACTATQACVNEGAGPACVEKAAQLPKMLAAAAKSVGRPGRANCGFCHFNAGGGDNVKMGDLASSLKAPAAHADVHMGSASTGGAGMTCVDCHVTQQHRIFGAGVSVAVPEGRTGCEDCHGGAEDAAFAAVTSHSAKHLAAIACQTCHIPAFSRQLPTKMRWDWSTAGIKDRTVPQTTHTTASGAVITTKDYDWMKGDFVWAVDVRPAYKLYDGKGTHLTVADAFPEAGTEADPVLIAAPSAGAGAKIAPFKAMSGKQAAMADGSFLLVPHLFGPGGFWDASLIPATGQTLESVRPIWTDVLTDGARKAGQIAADATLADADWEWVESRMYMNLNHEVAPKAKALGCSSCHSASAVIPFCEIYGGAKPAGLWGVTCP